MSPSRALAATRRPTSRPCAIYPGFGVVDRRQAIRPLSGSTPNARSRNATTSVGTILHVESPHSLPGAISSWTLDPQTPVARGYGRSDGGNDIRFGYFFYSPLCAPTPLRVVLHRIRMNGFRHFHRLRHRHSGAAGCEGAAAAARQPGQIRSSNTRPTLTLDHMAATPERQDMEPVFLTSVGSRS